MKKIGRYRKHPWSAATCRSFGSPLRCYLLDTNYQSGGRLPHSKERKVRQLAVLLVFVVTAAVPYPALPAASSVERDSLQAEISQFLVRELASHISQISTVDPPPAQVHGARTTGEYTWGTFMRAVGACAEMTGRRDLNGRDLAKLVGQIGLLEHRLGSKQFSQLYAAQTLRHFGRDLKTNPIWQGLSEQERNTWRLFLDPRSFYDPKTRNVIKLPENYLGVAARLAAINWQLGLFTDRVLMDDLLDRAAHQFTGGALYADDAPPTARFDRYSNEYARYIWDAAETAGRKDIMAALVPSLTAQMRLWWDLLSADGYGYAWGRSLGVVSYLDTLEIAGFVAQHPEFRPASLPDLAGAYLLAWRWLRRDYRDDSHLLSIFDFGRGNYRYISSNREWQQTVGFFGKVADSLMRLIPALEREGVNRIPTLLSLPRVARFEFFRSGQRKAGVWVVRQGPLSFSLPITTGTSPGISDYLPAPHGLPGFASPVEQAYPSLVPYLELDDGRVIVATDGADEIEPSAEGLSLKAVWRRWALVGGKPGETIDPHLTSEVIFRIKGMTLDREETLTASQSVKIRRWRFVVPTTAASASQKSSGVERWIRFESPDGILEMLSPAADWPLDESIVAAGNSALGRGARGAVPLHLVYESRDLLLQPRRPVRWRMALRSPGSPTVNTSSREK